MKIFFVTLALLMVGLVFIAPPLIAIAPVLFLGLLLMVFPLLLHGGDGGGRDDHHGVRSDQRATSGTVR